MSLPTMPENLFCFVNNRSRYGKGVGQSTEDTGQRVHMPSPLPALPLLPRPLGCIPQRLDQRRDRTPSFKMRKIDSHIS
ncbi:hypothetical protein QN277_004818 [Acacia crassicarpa]|uniref:Uncharacterized protein n=1 Tax=Acacia crassicarpa TaxID=499986 RepID=A0AAE1ME51_9FABA|nr:hypothetical protein QN277_004818 [Acacia crassicarpa]